MTIEALIKNLRPHRKAHGIAAALLPYREDGKIAVDAFQQHLVATRHAGLSNAVNMDTGYVNYLTDGEKLEVLKWAREALGKDVPFVAGAYIERRDGEIVSLYRHEMDAIVQHGGIPILFQTARLQGRPAREKIAAYQAIAKGY